MQIEPIQSTKECFVKLGSDQDNSSFHLPFQSIMQGLTLVATPIGNLADITLRGLMALQSADLILCEDTRHTGKLLRAFNIEKKRVSYHDHSDDQKRLKILNLLSQGKRLVLVSDAGIPLISDPGYKLIQAVVEAGFSVQCCPGANAALTALVTSTLPSNTFLFCGFIPSRKKDRNAALEKLKLTSSTLIFYETAKRMLSFIEACQSILGDRECCLSREITKKYETHKRGLLSQVYDDIQENGLKGECVLVIQGYQEKSFIEKKQEDQDWRNDLNLLIDKGQSLRESSKIVAEKYGLSRRMIYQYGIEISKSS